MPLSAEYNNGSNDLFDNISSTWLTLTTIHSAQCTVHSALCPGSKKLTQNLDRAVKPATCSRDVKHSRDVDGVSQTLQSWCV